jgi:hypothetical protein
MQIAFQLRRMYNEESSSRKSSPNILSTGARPRASCPGFIGAFRLLATGLLPEPGNPPHPSPLKIQHMPILGTKALPDTFLTGAILRPKSTNNI